MGSKLGRKRKLGIDRLLHKVHPDTDEERKQPGIRVRSADRIAKRVQETVGSGEGFDKDRKSFHRRHLPDKSAQSRRENIDEAIENTASVQPAGGDAGWTTQKGRGRHLRYAERNGAGFIGKTAKRRERKNLKARNQTT